ncbi:unnamed protein product, partial [Brenthis ino]
MQFISPERSESRDEVVYQGNICKLGVTFASPVGHLRRYGRAPRPRVISGDCVRGRRGGRAAGNTPLEYVPHIQMTNPSKPLLPRHALLRATTTTATS